MEYSASIAAIASVIYLAVALVFLLAGIAGILNVMTTRLGLIVCALGQFLYLFS